MQVLLRLYQLIQPPLRMLVHLVYRIGIVKDKRIQKSMAEQTSAERIHEFKAALCTAATMHTLCIGVDAFSSVEVRLPSRLAGRFSCAPALADTDAQRSRLTSTVAGKIKMLHF